jgi:hypothetical protein
MKKKLNKKGNSKIKKPYNKKIIRNKKKIKFN